MTSSAFAQWTFNNLDMQGFACVSEQDRRRHWAALKAVPATGLLGVLLVTVSGEPAIAYAFAAWMALGVFTPRHPSDLVFGALARAAGSDFRVGRTPAPRRFSSGFAAVMFTTIGLLIAFDAPSAIVIALEAGLIAAPATIVLTNWCLPAFIYGLIAGPPAAAEPAS